MKSHKGTLINWKKIPFKHQKDLPENLGYVVVGQLDRGRGITALRRTSAVVKHEGDEIETLNSRYTLRSPL